MTAAGGGNATRGGFRGFSMIPAAVLSTSGVFPATGGANPAVLIDKSDATYVMKSTLASSDNQAFTTVDPVIAANNVIIGVRPWMRDYRQSSASSNQLALFRYDGTYLTYPWGYGQVFTGQTVQQGFPSYVTGPVEDATGWVFGDVVPGTPGQVPWTPAALANICVQVWDRATVIGARTQFMELGADVWLASIPYAPTILTPTSGFVYVDSLTPTVQFTHNDTLVAAVINKALTSNVATITTTAAHGFLVGQMVTVAMNPADAVFDGTYQITAATTLTFSYARVNANVTSTAFNGSAQVGDGTAQASAEVRVFTAAQYGITGFDPGSSPNSGVVVVNGSQAFAALPTLVNGTSYRVYVRTSKVINGTTLASGWAFQPFTITLAQPPAPTLTATLDNPNQRVAIALTGQGNILALADDAAFNSSIGSWGGIGNCTTVWDSVAGDATPGSLSMASVAAGDMLAQTAGTLIGRFTVVPGQAYSVTGRVKAVASTRTCQVGIGWYDAGGGLLSQAFGTGVVNSAVGWTTITAPNLVAPAGAVIGAIIAVVKATGGAAETHKWDTFLIAPGTTVPAWSPGGISWGWTLARTQAGVTTVVRTVSALSNSQQTQTVYDYEAARGVATTYTGVLSGKSAAGLLTSPVQTSASVTPSNDGTWWMKAPLLPAVNAGGLRIQKGSLQYSRHEDLGTFRPLGRTKAVVIHGDMEGEDGSLILEVLGATEWAVIDALMQSGTTILLQDPNGTQKYIAFTDRSWTRTLGAAARRVVSLPYVEVDAP